MKLHDVQAKKAVKHLKLHDCQKSNDQNETSVDPFIYEIYCTTWHTRVVYIFLYNDLQQLIFRLTHIHTAKCFTQNTK